MLAKLSVLSAAALLAGGIGLATAQSNPPPAAGAANQGKCFDRATNQVRDKMAMGNSAEAGKKDTAATRSGSAPASSMGGPQTNTGVIPGATTGSAGSSAASANLPDC